MSEPPFVEKSLVEKINDLLTRKPKSHDVVFCVGPEKKLVNGVKLILKAASSVFEKEFEENWDVGVKNKGKRILLPDLDGSAFELFIKLTTLDTWSSETLTNLNLPPKQMLDLLTICTRFEMKTGKTNLEKMAQKFIWSSMEPKEEKKLMGLSPASFETLLGSDDFGPNETKVFQLACRWAKNKCTEMKLEETTENLRSVLGGSIFKIRFPLMSVTEFTEAMQWKQLLTIEECFQIYKFIGLDEQRKLNFDATPFSTKKRVSKIKKFTLSAGISTLCLTNGYSVVNDPPFVCDGKRNEHFFTSQERIELHGLGFLGPIHFDVNYDVNVEVFYRKGSSTYTSPIVTGKKRIFAKKGQMFHFMFDAPITLRTTSVHPWDSCDYDYSIIFSLKGPNTASVQTPDGEDQLICEGKHQFRFARDNAQLAELLFKKL